MNLPRLLTHLIDDDGLGHVVVSDGATDRTLAELLAALEDAHRTDVLLPNYRGSIEYDRDWITQYGPKRGQQPGRLVLSPTMKGYVARPWYVEHADEDGEDS